MTAIRAIFDGTSFIPQGPVSLPAQSEVLVFSDAVDQPAQDRLDEAIRAYYLSGEDADDQAWASSSAQRIQGKPT